MTTPSLLRHAAVALGASVVLAACGSVDDAGKADGTNDTGSAFSDTSAEAKVLAAKDAMRDLHSIQIAGTISNQGQEVAVDLQ